jgi:hypothetical protein
LIAIGQAWAPLNLPIEKGQRAGVGLDQIMSFSLHRTMATMLIYRDKHDRSATQRTLADVVARTLDEIADVTS